MGDLRNNEDDMLKLQIEVDAYLDSVEDPIKEIVNMPDVKVNYPPTPEAMGWASRVNAPTNVGNLP